MDSREALRRLKARRSERQTTEAREKSPLLQLLKGILAFLGPIIAVYYGNYYMARSGADAFAREFIAAIESGKIAVAYKEFTEESFREDEPLDGFASRMAFTERTMGKLQELEISLFEAPLLGGGALLQYDGKTSQKTQVKVNFVLVRQKLNTWQIARYVVNRAKP